MKRAAIVTALIFGMLHAKGESVTGFNPLADAIRRAEGNNPHWLYGIHHPGTTAPLSETEARRRCLNTIRHAFNDWRGQGSFVHFLSLRYCPANHAQWESNVSKFLNQ